MVPITNNRKRSMTRYFLLLLLIAACVVSKCGAQFGIPKANTKHDEEEVAIDSNGETQQQQQDGVKYLSDQDAADLEAILKGAREDAETIELIMKMKNEMSEELNELKQYSKEEILGSMKQSMDNMKLIDYLFAKGPEFALEEMIKENMIQKEHIKKYKKNPELLELDTRRGLYFEFVALSVTGGFL